MVNRGEPSAAAAAPARRRVPVDQEVVRLSDLDLPAHRRAWLAAQAAEVGGLARILRALVEEAIMLDSLRSQYDQEWDLRGRLRAEGRSGAEVRAIVLRWRRGEPVEGVRTPPAARVLHPGVASRVPQVRALRRA
jgi:hypothetical protein